MKNTTVLWCILGSMVLSAKKECCGQTVVLVGGGATITCPATPIASWTTPPPGVTFSNWSRGSGVSCASAVNGLSGSAFNTANASASFSANKYFRVSITADLSHSLVLNSINWNTAVSSGTCVFDLQYRNNGGSLTSFGAVAQTGTTSNTFTGSVTVAPGTSIDLFLIPSGTLASGTTVRWLNGSSITITASETSPLPVSIIYFGGYKMGVHNQLSWSTAFEQNNTGFEVLRSMNGRDFTSIGFVDSKAQNGNSNEVINYTFTDNDPGGIKQYYQLRQVDMDNHSKLSPIIMIQTVKPRMVYIDGLYPNPSNELINILVICRSKDKMVLLITDLAGKRLLEKVVNVEAGSNKIPVDIHLMSKGIYMVWLSCRDIGENIGCKFEKQ